MNKLLNSNQSIRTRLLLFFVFFGITITTSHFLTSNSFGNLEKYQTILSKASQSSDIVELIALHSAQVLNNQQTAKTLLSDDIARYQVNFDLLKNGGKEVVDNFEIELPPCEPSALGILLEIEQLWNQYKTKAEFIANQNTYEEGIVGGQRIINPSIAAAEEFIVRNRPILIASHQQFNNIYTDISKERKEIANNWLVSLWIANLSLIIFGFLLIQQWVIQPLSRITQVAERIGDGDLSQKINFQSQNEVGHVATAINGMVEKIRHATEFIKNIEQGDLSVSYSGLNGKNLEKDTLAGALLNMRDRMKTVAIEEDERNWSTIGLAKFSEILQTFNDDTEQLSYEIISNLVKYLNANQGALFIVDDEDADDVHLNLIAAYAFNRRRYFDRKVKMNEGLVGQSFKDADTIYITDIPDNYVDITSGLGGSQPKSVLVVPLKLIDRVYGVIELASFDEIKKYQIDFLEKLSENIASNLYASRANEQTKRLLFESTKITEQMRTQEQEMRRNLKVLESTQTEMQKNQEALAAQSYAIKNTLITVELGIDRSILSVNELFLEATKYTEQEILGKDHLMFVPRTQVNDTYYEKLWRDLRAGTPRSGEFKRIDKFGNEIWLRATYSPIKDKNGIPYKILKLAFDVTEDKKLRLDFKEQIDSFKRSSAIVEFDLNGKIIEVNDNFLDLMEYSRDEIIGQDHTIIVPDEEKYARSYQALWHKLRQGSYHIGEVRRITKTGKSVWFQGSFNPILDLNGNPYKVIEFIIDITNRKQTEARIIATKEELQTKEANLVALLNNTDDAIYTISPNYRVTLLNESAKRLYDDLGTSLRISSHALEALPRNYYYIWKGYFDRALGGEKFHIEQAIFSEEMNAKIYLSVYFNPIIDDSKEISGVAIFSRDITGRKQRELDIADFTRKQNIRTGRIIENQKQNLVIATETFEKEKQDLKAWIAAQEITLNSITKWNDFLNKGNLPLIAVNHDYELMLMNEQAKKLFHLWHLYLQPAYFMPDTFPLNKYSDWKKHLDNALSGAEFSVDLIIPNKYNKTVHAFVIGFTPIKNKLQQVTHIVFSIKDVSEAILKRKALERQKRKEHKAFFKKELQFLTKSFEKQVQVADEAVQKIKRQLVQQQEILDLLNRTTEVILKIDKDYLVKTYNMTSKKVFFDWQLYLQPDYLLLDIFPLEIFDEMKMQLDKAFAGEEVQLTFHFVNRKMKNIRTFHIALQTEKDENDTVNFVWIQAKDISDLCGKARNRKYEI